MKAKLETEITVRELYCEMLYVTHNRSKGNR